MKSFEMMQFRKDNFDSMMMKECLGKEKCTVDLNYFDFARLPAS